MKMTLKNMARVGLLMLSVSFIHSAAEARDLYVDQANGSDDYDGLTAQTAKRTIQAAVDIAKSRDTVKVAEGVYEDKNTHADGTSACVVISNNLTLVATGAKEKTHIVGRHADTATGVGEGAVRCIYVKSDSKKTVRIQGFTIRDGATVSGNGGGVAFAVYDSEKNIERGWLVDCVVSNCVAVRGGALLYGTAIRCLFSGNASGGSDKPYGTVASQSILYNCLAVENVGGDRLFNYPRAIVNCTIAGNNMNNFCYSSGAHYIYNTIFLENAEKKFHNSNAVLSNCLVSSGISDFNRTASGMCATNDSGHCFFAPATGDWRPVAESGASGLGDASHLASVNLPEESLRYVDYAGNPIAQSGSITCGAIQETVETRGGYLNLNGRFAVDGMGVSYANRCKYIHSTNYPCMYKLKAVDATISNIVWYSSTTGLAARIPTYDGWVGVMPPPSGKMTLKPVYASKVVYADAVNGDDDYVGEDIGSWDHPYRTLQAAFNSIPDGTGNEDDNLSYSVICAKPGDYNDGGTVDATIARRLYIKGYRRVRVVALEGPEKTVIRGCSQADSPEGVQYGCLFMNSPSVVQGFTLTDGHAGDSGAALQCAINVSDRVIADCIVSNNVSASSGIQRGGLSVRCTFLDNRATASGGADITSGYASHCIFRTSDETDKDAYTLGGSSRAYFTTYKGRRHNNAVHSGALAAAASCRFVDMPADDYRLRSDSPAFGAGDADPENYWKFANLDMAGNVLNFIGDRPTAGAYQQPSAVALAVDSGSGALSVGGEASLTNTVLPETSVTITKAADCGRNLLGFRLPDGTFFEAQSYTYTAPSAFSAGRVECIDAVFSTNWYVNASLGDDANDGFTPETPKKTLAGAMAAAVLPGDTVHAAPGDYDKEEMLHDKKARPDGGETVIGTRVVVPKGVTLVSDCGPDVTHIIGASASEEYDVRGLGLGSNAVRCVFLSAGARLKGFTLRGGRTNSNTGFQENCAFGGGVLGVGSASSFVEDCVISNCMAMYGAAGYSAHFKRCRFFHNRAVTRSSVTRSSYHDSCIADWNQGAHPFDYYVMMTNCTIGANQKDADGKEGHCLVYPSNMDKALVVDCLLLGRVHSNVRMRRTAALATSGVSKEKCEDCILTNRVSLDVDSEYRPVIGKNVAIDAIPLAEEDASVRAEKDVYGVQRVFNGARDLGALDADWRGHYAKTLGGRGLVVTDADPTVVGTNGALRIKDGSLCVDWRTPGDSPRTHLMDVAVSGGGEMSVTKDGELFASVTEGASGVRKFRASGSSSMEFSFAADDQENGYGEVKSLRIPFGTAISVR